DSRDGTRCSERCAEREVTRTAGMGPNLAAPIRVLGTYGDSIFGIGDLCKGRDLVSSARLESRDRLHESISAGTDRSCKVTGSRIVTHDLRRTIKSPVVFKASITACQKIHV